MQGYKLVVDVWEAETNLDYGVLKQNGVDGIVIRLNSISGGLHMDANFVTQWSEAGAAGFARAPYFVFNPWRTGAENATWLFANLPGGYKGRIFVDVEVKYTVITTGQYATELAKFCEIVNSHNPVSIYTGEWFLPNLSKWPSLYTYWWAQYMNVLYDNVKYVLPKTWDALRTVLAGIQDKPTNAIKCPGFIRLWQISGDRLILPGSTREIDVNVFFGTTKDLYDFFGTPQVVEPPADVITLKSVTVAGLVVPEVVTVTWTTGAGDVTQTIDQTPIVVPPPPPPGETTNLYRVAAECWPITHAPLTKPGDGGPLTQPMSHTPKIAHETTALSVYWQNYIKLWNNAKGWEKISAPNFGPSKGFNDNGKLIYIGLVYPGANHVNVLEIQGEWARIQSIQAVSLTEDPIKTPWLFHRVCDNLGNPVLVDGKPIICPIIGGPWWVPMIALKRV